MAQSCCGSSWRAADWCKGIAVSGSANQPGINGCYVDRHHSVAGQRSYENENGEILYYVAESGQWVISATIGSGFRAAAAGSGMRGPVAVPPGSWLTYKHIGADHGWVAERLDVVEAPGTSSCFGARHEWSACTMQKHRG